MGIMLNSSRAVPKTSLESQQSGLIQDKRASRTLSRSQIRFLLFLETNLEKKKRIQDS